MKTIVKSLVGLAVLTSLSATAVNAQDTLRLGTEGAFPPFNYIDSSGQLAGFDVDIGLALCEEMGRECELVAQDWDGIIPGLIANKYDFVIASMFITEERKKQVAFSDPYYLAAMSYVAAKDAGITDFSPEALSNRTFGAQSGTTQADFIQAVYPQADLRLYASQDDANLDMASGRLDLMVGDTIPLSDWTLKTEDGACCEIIGDPITDPEFVGDGVGIAIRQADTDLVEAINAALATIIENGTYKEINDQYFDINVRTMKAE
ncbi:ABC transporter substrate-binding protein [Roseovarius sp. EL26]|uniref:ABC transporter substrate-binding protein n=1 Tax=Roseovarius sp. EL26 TaxID=2126672 RepID=UPI000EA33BA0|nr:ABC transporter substrate-binding protein [Roseovarius sp. EL26]